MPSLSTLVSFGAASALLIVIPGPAVLFIINRSITNGRRVGLAAVAGIEVGTLVHVVAAVVGLSAVLAASATAFTVVKWAGALYLVGIGIRTLFTKATISGGQPGSLSPDRAFRQGVFVNILNPKVALFFVAFLPQFIDPDRLGWTQSLVLGLLFTVIASVSDMLYVVVATSMRDVLSRGRSLPFLQRYVSGTVFIGLGIVAATTGHAKSSTS